jgi:hypothetical protein
MIQCWRAVNTSEPQDSVWGAEVAKNRVSIRGDPEIEKCSKNEKVQNISVFLTSSPIITGSQSALPRLCFVSLDSGAPRSLSRRKVELNPTFNTPPLEREEGPRLQDSGRGVWGIGYSPQESRGTTKDRLTKNKNGRIVSKKASANAKKTEPSQSPGRAQPELSQSPGVRSR